MPYGSGKKDILFVCKMFWNNNTNTQYFQNSRSFIGFISVAIQTTATVCIWCVLRMRAHMLYIVNMTILGRYTNTLPVAFHFHLPYTPCYVCVIYFQSLPISIHFAPSFRAWRHTHSRQFHMIFSSQSMNSIANIVIHVYAPAFIACPINIGLQLGICFGWHWMKSWQMKKQQHSPANNGLCIKQLSRAFDFRQQTMGLGCCQASIAYAWA